MSGVVASEDGEERQREEEKESIANKNTSKKKQVEFTTFNHKTRHYTLSICILLGWTRRIFLLKTWKEDLD